MTRTRWPVVPEALEALEASLDTAHRIVDRLEGERDPAVRAQLAMELISATSMVCDTMERAVEPALVSELAIHAREQSDRLRAAMLAVDHWTRHVAPGDVHRSEPEAFEHELDGFMRTFREVTSWEAREIYPYLMTLSVEKRSNLRDHVTRAHKHASEHPVAGGPVARLINKVEAKMERHPDTGHRDDPDPDGS